MTEPRPELRAADVDRELVASQLRRHASAGRLTLEELDQRLGWAYEAKTMGDLAKLTSDLPDLSKERTDLSKLPPPSPHTRDEVRDQRHAQRDAGRDAQRTARRGPHRYSDSRTMWGSYAAVNLMQIVIWAIVCAASTHWVYPWWLWIAGPWGVALIGQEIQRRTRPDNHDRSLER